MIGVTAEDEAPVLLDQPPQTSNVSAKKRTAIQEVEDEVGLTKKARAGERHLRALASVWIAISSYPPALP